ncbi:hypothetical protein E2C01_019769 [Portunus trituberculatus]|uniref:Uncharacterized protein n=1 Tax=Portunus trituberculatus TaxID=210409 RepID=A0A5B7DZK3_PORTR|nr:hypothetical protein [Portunus trituberculatus]
MKKIGASLHAITHSAHVSVGSCTVRAHRPSPSSLGPAPVRLGNCATARLTLCEGHQSTNAQGPEVERLASWYWNHPAYMYTRTHPSQGLAPGMLCGGLWHAPRQRHRSPSTLGNTCIVHMRLPTPPDPPPHHYHHLPLLHASLLH